MNQRQFVRNIGRIPRILFHMKRITADGDPEKRVPGFKTELERRKMEMKLADMQERTDVHPTVLLEGRGFDTFADLLKYLLTLKLARDWNEDYGVMTEMVKQASVGMSPGIAELTPPTEAVN